MPFSDMLNDTVSLLKKNGERVENIQASVQPKMIFIQRSDILIETGDLIQRKMSNGGEETYQVIDPGFYEAFDDDMPAHYQIKHKKLGLPETEKAVQSITYNFSGANARVNNNSVDNSTNIINLNSDVADHISMLRQEIQKIATTPEQKKESLEIVDAIEGQFKTEKPSKTVLKTLIDALPSAGSIAAIGSFLLSCLGG